MSETTNKVDDGGPAFPVPLAALSTPNGDHVLYDSLERCAGGMTLRDYFAAKAMAAMIACYQETMRGTEDAKTESDADLSSFNREMALDVDRRTGDCDGALEIAGDAYRFADAMIAARGGGQ